MNLDLIVIDKQESPIGISIFEPMGLFWFKQLSRRYIVLWIWNTAFWFKGVADSCTRTEWFRIYCKYDNNLLLISLTSRITLVQLIAVKFDGERLTRSFYRKTTTRVIGSTTRVIITCMYLQGIVWFPCYALWWFTTLLCQSFLTGSAYYMHLEIIIRTIMVTCNLKILSKQHFLDKN